MLGSESQSYSTSLIVNDGAEVAVGGDLTQAGKYNASSELRVNGLLNVGGSYNGIGSYSYLYMQNDNSYMEVYGDFINKSSSGSFIKGTLAIGRNYKNATALKGTTLIYLRDNAYNITINDSNNVLISDYTDLANFGTVITTKIKSDVNKKYYIYIKDTDGSIIKQGIAGVFVFNMPAKDIIISTEYIGFDTSDVNMDGVVNKADAALLLKHISGITALNELSLAIADVNNDGNVDMTDAVAILNMAA